MKCFGKLVVGLAAGLVFNAGTRADDTMVASADNPYAPIVARNVFSLNPPTPEDAQAAEPPPKITLTGIMSDHGKLQALYKVAGTGKPGQPPKDQYYILSEGQRQDDVEVTHIDDQAGLVTFNNHGTVQEIPLANAPTITATGSPPGPGGPVSRTGPAGRRSGGPNGRDVGNETDSSSRRGAGRQNRGRGNDMNQNPGSPLTGGITTLGGMPAMGGGLSTPSSPALGGTYNSQPNQGEMTPEESALLIEAQRELYRSQGNPAANILPPTKYTLPAPAGAAASPAK